MSADIRKLDRIIDTATRKLAAVQARQTWALPASEQAKLAGLATVVVAKATRLKSSPTADRGITRIWEQAEERLRAEITAAQTAKAEALHRAAKAKTERKAKGWW